MVAVNVQVALGGDVQAKTAVPRHLIQHVFKKRQACLEGRLTAAVQIDLHLNLRLKGGAPDDGAAFSARHYP